MSASTKTYKGFGSIRVFDRTEFNNAVIKTLSITETLPSSINTSGGLQVSNNAIFGKSVSILHTMPSTSSITGGLRVEGGVGINSTYNSISVSNGGGLTCSGGAAFLKDVRIGGSIYANETVSCRNLNVSEDVEINGNVAILGNIEAESLELTSGFTAQDTELTNLSVSNDCTIGGSQNIAGALSVGNGVSVSQPSLFSGDVRFTSTLVNTSTTTGAVRITGGVLISCTQGATSTTRGGSFLTLGGASIAKNLIVGQSITAQSTLFTSVANTNYENTSSAALRVSGGGAYNGALYVQGDIYAKSRQFVKGEVFRRMTTQNVSNVNGVFYTWSQLENKILLRLGHNDNATDYLPTAASIIANVVNIEIGTSLILHFRNGSETNNFNIAPGDGGSISPNVLQTISIPPLSTRAIVLRFVTLTTYELFSLNGENEFEWNPISQIFSINGTVQAQNFSSSLTTPTITWINPVNAFNFVVKNVLYERRNEFAMINISFTVIATQSNNFVTFEISIPDRQTEFTDHEDVFGTIQAYEYITQEDLVMPVTMIALKAKVGTNNAFITFLPNTATLHRIQGTLYYRFE